MSGFETTAGQVYRFKKEEYGLENMREKLLIAFSIQEEKSSTSHRFQQFLSLDSWGKKASTLGKS